MNYLKAIYGMVATFLASLSSVLVGSESFSQITDAQWVTIAVATLASGAVIFGVPNAKIGSGSSDPVAPAAAPVVPPLPPEPAA